MAHKLYVDGAWRAREDLFPVVNPADGSEWTQAADADRSDAAQAIESAASAAAGWAKLPHTERARYLLKAADIVEARQGELVDSLVDEAGSWIGKAMFESGYVPGIFRAAAAAVYQTGGEILPSEHHKVSMVQRQPLGVVSVISPWNFPALLSSRGFAVALAVGNTVVLKPSEETPVSGGLFFAEVFEEAGLPPGVLNVVTCSRDRVAEVGDELVSSSHVNGISFTGSTAVGREIASRAGFLLKKACVELGGKDALLILDDADLDRAVNAATFGSFMHQGQICMSVERIIAAEPLAEEFAERFAANARRLKSGNPRDPGCPIGPIINQRQLEKISSQVEEARGNGAKVLAGGTRNGNFYDATVLAEVTPDMRVFSEETFGPVAAVISAADDDEAIAIANDSEYGLSAGIITADEERGLDVARRLETGMAHVNDSSVNDEPHVPFGGVKSSGLGRHGGRAAIDTFTEMRWITLERGGRHYPPPFLEPK